MEKLIVSNFLNIKYIELELGKINILIGSQAQGKSVVAKLVYFFQKFWQDYCIFLSSNRQEIFNKSLIKQFKIIFPQYTWIEQDFEINYLCEQYKVRLIFDSKNQTQQDLKISYSLLREIINDYKNYQDLAEQFTNKFIEEQTEILVNEYIDKIANQKFEEFKEEFLMKKITQELFFIPSGRSFFSFLKENIFDLTNNFQFEYFMKTFSSIYNRSDTKYKYQNRHQKTGYDPMIDILTERILKGKYTYEQEIDFIASEDKRKIRLIDASSGQQEALPIIVLLTTFGLADNNCFFFIEEPEAHLFPAAQNDIVNLMSLIFNLTEKRHSFFITTHSPYILTAFNTLIQADNTYNRIIVENREHQLPELFKIVPENQMLDIKDIKVYSLENGKIENIINEDNQLIDANIIDEISNCTGEQFDKLLDLEFNNG